MQSFSIPENHCGAFTLRSGWGQYGPSCLHTIPPLRLPPSAPPSHFYDRECQFGCQGNRLFSCNVETRGEGRVAFVPPCDEGFTLCMFNRQTYGPGPNTRAHLPQPDYVQWSCWHLHLASFIMQCSSHSGHLRYCCWWVQLRPQLVRSNKEGTHVSLTITSHMWTLSVGHNTFCLFRITAPTHHCLP